LKVPGIGSKAVLAACGAASAALLAAGTAAADSGGVGAPGSTPPPTTTTPTATPPPPTTTTPGAKGRIGANGLAIAPASAPPAVKAVIAAANRIATKPYIWGGGHGRWWDRGYDCSGSVSYALHGGSFLTSPMDSTDLEGWGSRGPGSWITVYANAGHAYAIIAGLRWDTSGNARGISGPRWHKNLRTAQSGSYVVRHPTGY
jgi:cell wall-associated NlpC family hydrolase